MSDIERRAGRDQESGLADVIDLAARRIMTGLIIAGGAIGLGLYAQPGPPRYQVVATETGIARVNTRSGYVITCTGERCYRTLRPGQDFERTPKAPQATQQPAQQQLPAPAQSSEQQPAATTDAGQPAPASR